MSKKSKKRKLYGHMFDPKPYRRPSISWANKWAKSRKNTRVVVAFLTPNPIEDHRFTEPTNERKSRKNTGFVVTFLTPNPIEDHRFPELKISKKSKKRKFCGSLFDPKPYRRPSIYWAKKGDIRYLFHLGTDQKGSHPPQKLHFLV